MNTNNTSNKEYKFKKVIGIRRENKNKWERRVSLIPTDVKKLTDLGIRVIFQPDNLRCFSNKQFTDAGAEEEEDISQADYIFGVKEIPVDLFIKDKTFIFFSHTFKGRVGNLPMLDKCLDLNIRLVDYELIKENKKENPQRLVAFGQYAGIVGAIDFLQGIGEFLLHKKMYTPLLHIGYSYMYTSRHAAKEAISKIGATISKKHFPKRLVPFLYCITGNGRVAKGAQEIMELLPHQWVDCDDLEKLFSNENISKLRNDIIYLTKIEHKHMYALKEDKKAPFNKEHFLKNKSQYCSVFAEKYLPYLSVILHCMYWDPESPVIISEKEAHDLSEMNRLRLLGISDITCDFPVSSIELIKKETSIEKPFYTIDPMTGLVEEEFSKMSNKAILYHAVDHLPAELSFDASRHFSEKLTPFIEEIIKSGENYPCDYKDGNLPTEIFKACETWNGKLVPEYEYLYDNLKQQYPEKYKK